MDYYGIQSINQRTSETNILDYNCMSYVFNASEWLCPFEFDDEFYSDEDIEAFFDELVEEDKDFFGELSTNEELRERIMNLIYKHSYFHPIIERAAILRMKKFFPELKEVESFSSLNSKKEYGIIFATATTGDFHFGKFEDNQYSHKAGGKKIKFVDSEDEIFLPLYIGKRYYFTLPKGKIEVNY